jgi:alkylation response protein AidB-like acyl-CoA dehydrogenase
MNMAALMLAKLGTPAQQARWLAPLLAGRIKVWVGITEPDHGSDVASMRTRATRRGDDWVIDGRKLWITNGAIGDLGILMARAVGEDGAPGGITAFLVDPTESRFEARRVHTMVLKATVTSELTFDGTVVPGANVLGGVGEGLRNILVTLGFGRLSVAAGAVGAMRRAYELAHAYALSRTQFGAPIGGFQLVQQMIVEMHLRLESSRQMLRRAARALDAGRAGRLECSTAKLYCTRAAHEVANLALQVHGGIGYSEDLPIERIFRDTRGAIIPEGTSEIQTLIIGRELLGLSALEPPRGAPSR